MNCSLIKLLSCRDVLMVMINAGIDIKSFVAISLTTRELRRFCMEWVITTKSLTRGYPAGRYLSQNWEFRTLPWPYSLRYILNRVCGRFVADSSIDLSQMIKSEPELFAARIIDAFTCYCGATNWDVMNTCGCWKVCDSCDRRDLPDALLMTTTVERSCSFQGGVITLSRMKFKMCRFGCLLICDKCNNQIYSGEWSSYNKVNKAECVECSLICGVARRVHPYTWMDGSTGVTFSSHYIFSNDVPLLETSFVVPNRELTARFDPRNPRI